MKVIRKERVIKKFEEVEVGKCFLHNDCVYMCCVRGKENSEEDLFSAELDYYGVDLRDGTLEVIHPGTEVEVLEDAVITA